MTLELRPVAAVRIHDGVDKEFEYVVIQAQCTLNFILLDRGCVGWRAAVVLRKFLCNKVDYCKIGHKEERGLRGRGKRPI